MRLVRWIPVAATSVALCACAAFPPYKPPVRGPETATIDVSRINASTICTNGEFYSVGKVKDGKLTVLANSRTAVYSWVYIADCMVNYSCMPGISFRPESGQTYLMNLEIENQACRLEVYKQGANNRVGLELVPSIGPATYCR